MDTLEKTIGAGAGSEIARAGGSAGAGRQLVFPVRVATDGDITLSGPQTIDGETVATGHFVLVKDQSDDTENGVYMVSPGDWTKIGQPDVVVVRLGTLYGRVGFILTDTDAYESMVALYA